MANKRRKRRDREQGYAAPLRSAGYAHIGSAFAAEAQRKVGGRDYRGTHLTGRMVAWDLTRNLRPWARDRVMELGR